jgi:hypothetical protein
MEARASKEEGYSVMLRLREWPVLVTELLRSLIIWYAVVAGCTLYRCAQHGWIGRVEMVVVVRQVSL